MPRNRELMKLADYVVIALNPALVMAMVGALVFFLVEVLYVGQYQGTLLYILFFFVFGGVLVSRISIEFNDNRATLYGVLLGGLTWLGTMRYAGESNELINLVLLAVIWWSSHRLTRDCTVIDDSQDASGAGLLEEAGIEEQNEAPAKDESSASNFKDPNVIDEKPKKKSRKSEFSSFSAWMERYRTYREEQQRQPHAPGVWVVYFSLAALPLYGVGQSLIPAADVARREYVFWLMSIYVAAGLGLLLTTSFLGLRRYLRQKKLQMPWAITAAWMSIGLTLIVIFLLFGALLPRPSAEFALIQLPWQANSTDQNADKMAVRGDEAGKGESRRVVKGKDDPKDATDKGKGNKDSGAKKAQGNAKSKDGGAKKGDGTAKGAGDKKNADAPNQKEKANEREAQAKGNEPEQQPQSSMFEKASEALAKLAALLKPILIGIIVLFMVFVVGRALLVFLANFTGWAAGLLKFLQSFRKKSGPEKSGSEEVGPEQVSAPLPFAEFSDPFATGTSQRMSPAELVRYTFEALESWAWARDLARKPGETPFELAERIGEDRPGMEECVGQLANHYAGLAYANATLTDECRESVRQCWRQMSGAHERIASPGSAR